MATIHSSSRHSPLRDRENCRAVAGAVLLAVLSLGTFPALLYAQSPPGKGDLTVGWISRLPVVDFVRSSPNPGRDGWPEPGQIVTWRAHVKNFSSRDLDNVGFRWALDGVEVARGAIDLPAGAYVPVDFPWTWSFDRHRLDFSIDVDDAIDEEEERNNALSIFTDSLSTGFYVERSLYEHFRANQYRLGVHSTCFENWAQRHIDRFNEMAALARYPETPAGVIDRLRLDEIAIVEDGALPLVPLTEEEIRLGGGATTHPNKDDRTVDLQWGFLAKQISSYNDFTTVSDTNPFYFNRGVLHELGHARYLIDVYGFDVLHDSGGNSIQIRENGSLVAGSPLMPLLGPFAHFTPEQGLMNRDYTFIDRYSAMAMNLIAHHRATEGNYNEPGNLGEFMQDLPLQNRLILRDRSGNILSDADVRIYQARPGDPDVWYSRIFDDVPDLQLRTDALGGVLVGRDPFGSDGTIHHHLGFSDAVAILRVQKGGDVHYGFLEVLSFNIAYWKGQRSFAEHEIIVGASQCGRNVPQLLAPAQEASGLSSPVSFRWSSVAGAASYLVFASHDLDRPRLIGRTSSNTLSARLAGDFVWWVEAEIAGCPSLRSETGRFRTALPTRMRPVQGEPSVRNSGLRAGTAPRREPSSIHGMPQVVPAPPR